MFLVFPNVLFCCLWFSLVFPMVCLFFTQKTTKEKRKPSGKPKETTKKKLNPHPRVGLKPLTTLLFWCSRRFFFSFLYFWFSLMFVWFSKNLRENQKTKTYPRVGLKPLNTLLFWFSRRFFVFFLYVWFSLMFVWFSKNLRENQTNTKRKHIKGWV